MKMKRLPYFDEGVVTYKLRKFERTNQDTTSNQIPIVKVGDKVVANQPLADGCAT